MAAFRLAAIPPVSHQRLSAMPAARPLLFAAVSAAMLVCAPVAAVLGSEPLVRGDLTAKDLKRVRTVTEPATDFSKPESFEAMPAGAAEGAGGE